MAAGAAVAIGAAPADILPQPAAAEGWTFARAVRGKAFYLLMLAAGLISFTAVYNSHVPAFAQSIGMAPEEGAILASTFMIGTIVMKLALGWLIDRLGVRRAMLAALSVLSAAFIVIALTGWPGLVLYSAIFICGLGPAMMALLPSQLTVSLYGYRDYARIFAYTTMGSSFVSAFANSGIGYIYDWSGSYQPAFMLGVVVCVLAAVSALLAMHWVAHPTATLPNRSAVPDP